MALCLRTKHGPLPLRRKAFGKAGHPFPPVGASVSEASVIGTITPTPLTAVGMAEWGAGLPLAQW